MSKVSAMRDVWQFLRTQKRYWLVPLVVVFLLFGSLLVLAEGTAVAPFIYTLF